MTAHWIKGNEMSRQPNRWVWLAVGSRAEAIEGGEVLVWDGAVTCCDSRETNASKWREPKWEAHSVQGDMWARIGAHCRDNQRTVVMAWDMGEVVRLAWGLQVLPALGWELERWQVGDRFTLLKWRRGKQSLTLTDASGCLPMGKQKVGSMAGPVDVDTRTMAESGDWFRVGPVLECAQLRAAMLDLLGWQADADLGNWQPTSGSQAWAHWRHRHYTNAILVHDDERARVAEREAAYAGRCEAWRHGALADDVWTEWDLPLAYASVCLTLDVPTVLRGRVRNPPPAVRAGQWSQGRWLIRARVKTGRPILPTRHEGGLVWPVGEFEGWWWDVELFEAMHNGAVVWMLDSYHYSASLALADWAHYVTRFVNGEEEGSTPLRRAVVKGWCRSLIGRFGTRYWSWEDWGASDVQGIRMDRLANRETGQEGRWLHVGGRNMVAQDMVDGVETAPAVMSAVMAECRIRLWRIIQAAGPENVAYCDTDSVLVNQEGDRRLAIEGEGWGHWGLRRKGHWRNLEVHGPRQVVSARERRMSGVPASAVSDIPGSFAGFVSEGLEAAAAAGNLAGVVRRNRTWAMTGTDRRRVHLAGGLTEPVRL